MKLCIFAHRPRVECAEPFAEGLALDARARVPVCGDHIGSVSGDRMGSVSGDRMGRFCGDRVGSVCGDRVGSVSGDRVGRLLCYTETRSTRWKSLHVD